MQFISEKSPSLLSRDESTAIKGLLILLIVLGHNSIVMGKTGLFPYLYSFHVYCFYILPFIYGFQIEKDRCDKFRLLWGRQWKNLKRLGSLYLFWCAAGIGAGLVFKHVTFQPWNCARAILWGHQILLTDYCGFSFLWFLPTILAVMFWRDLYFLLPPIGKILLFLCAVSLWGLAIAGIGNYYSLGAKCPFALVQGLYFSMAGIAVRFILEHLPKQGGEISRCLILLAPLVPLYVYVRRFLPQGCNYLTWSCCPVIAFICLYAAKDWLKQVKIFQIAGKYSLQIYLLHTIIFNFLLCITKGTSLFSGIVIYFLTLLLCGAVIFIIEKTKIFRWMIFSIKG